MMRMHATDANPTIIDVEAELLGPRKLGETFEVEPEEPVEENEQPDA
jgi:hypothetical protein